MLFTNDYYIGPCIYIDHLRIVITVSMLFAGFFNESGKARAFAFLATLFASLSGYMMMRVLFKGSMFLADDRYFVMRSTPLSLGVVITITVFCEGFF